MGYTHYWSLRYDGSEPPDAFGRTAFDAKRIVEHAIAEGVPLHDGRGGGTPLLDEALIWVGGYDDSGELYSTFVLEPRRPVDTDYGWTWGEAWEGPGWWTDHCGTGRHAYDPVVACILARAAVHYGDAIRVRSDGEDEWGDDPRPYATWHDARELHRAVFGEDMPRPFTAVPILAVV